MSHKYVLVCIYACIYFIYIYIHTHGVYGCVYTHTFLPYIYGILHYIFIIHTHTWKIPYCSVCINIYSEYYVITVYNI